MQLSQLVLVVAAIFVALATAAIVPKPLANKPTEEIKEPSGRSGYNAIKKDYGPSDYKGKVVHKPFFQKKDPRPVTGYFCTGNVSTAVFNGTCNVFAIYDNGFRPPALPGFILPPLFNETLAPFFLRPFGKFPYGHKGFGPGYGGYGPGGGYGSGYGGGYGGGYGDHDDGYGGGY